MLDTYSPTHLQPRPPECFILLWEGKVPGSPLTQRLPQVSLRCFCFCDSGCRPGLRSSSAYPCSRHNLEITRAPTAQLGGQAPPGWGTLTGKGQPGFVRTEITLLSGEDPSYLISCFPRPSSRTVYAFVRENSPEPRAPHSFLYFLFLPFFLA